ncbi:MAG: histidine phosphatase family protein [Clostridiales bacterium]|nr:histidine phosphatase family protein [Clostridiales bacterium]
MKLTLLRHGNTEGNVRGLYYGASDIPILPESEEELKALAEKGGYPVVGKYYTSGMKRAEQSFAALYGDIPHEALPGMREIDLGEFEMRSYEELKNDPKFIEWCTGDNEKNVCPGGESGEQVTDRALAALKPIIEAGEDAVIITHGGVIGGVLARLFPNPNGRFAFTPGTGTGYTVEFDGTKPVRFCKTPAEPEENE